MGEGGAGGRYGAPIQQRLFPAVVPTRGDKTTRKEARGFPKAWTGSGARDGKNVSEVNKKYSSSRGGGGREGRACTGRRRAGAEARGVRLGCGKRKEIMTPAVET